MATKTESVAFKVTPEEKALLKQMALEKDVTISKLIYRMVFPKGGKE